MPHPLPPSLTTFLARFARRRRALVALRGLGEAAAALVVALAAIAAFDAIAHPRLPTRVALSALAYAGALALVALRALIPIARREPLARVARRVERATGGRDERLSSAVELARDDAAGLAGWMVARTIALAGQEADRLDPRALVDARPARRAALRALAAVALVALACLAPGVPALVARAAAPFAEIARPSTTRIAVHPGSAIVARGASFAIAADIAPAPTAAEAELRWADGLVERLPLARDATGGWRLALPTVTQDFSYEVVAGDGESARYGVAVGQPPEVRSVRVRVQPPAYARAAASEADGGDATVLAGSAVTVSVALAGTRAAAASLTLEDGAEQALDLGDDGVARATLTPDKSIAYGVRVTGVNGLVEVPPSRWLIAVQPDQPPTVTLAGEDLQAGLIAPDETVLFTGEAQDDVGLKRVEIVVADEAGAIDRRPLPLPDAGAPARRLDVVHALTLSAADGEAGERLQVALEATDLGGQVARSAAVPLVLAKGDEARAAALGARLRAELAKLDGDLDGVRTMPRQWSAIGRALRADEPASSRGELLSLRNRANVVGASVAAIARRLADEYRTNSGEFTPTVVALGARLDDWATSFHALALAAVGGATDARDAAPFEAGRELTEASVADLARLRQDLALLVARLDAEALVANATAARARAARGALVVRGARGWTALAGAVGLEARFWTGRDLAGDALLVERATLPWRSLAPAGRTVNWCARLSGDVRIDAEGDWTFDVLADDGVRLAVDGQQILPAEAWSDHGPTQYRGVAHLAAGWHPLVVEFYQGGGPSTLALRWAAGAAAPVDVPVDHLRPPRAIDEATARAMAAIAPDQLDAALARLGRESAAMAAVPGVIARIAELAVDAETANIAAERRDASAAILASLPAIERWSLADLDVDAQRIDALADAALRCRERLRQLAGEMAKRQPLPDGLTAARALADALRAKAQELRDLPAAAREARAPREQAEARALAAQVPAALARARGDAERQAGDAWAAPAARARAVERWERLDTESEQAAADAAAALAPPQVDQAGAERARAAAERLGASLAGAAQQAESARRERQADRARSAIEDARVEAAARARGDLAAAERAHAAVAAAAKAIAADERARGDAAVADRVASAVPARAEDADPAAEQRALVEVAERDRRDQPALGDTATAQLARNAQRLDATERAALTERDPASARARAADGRERAADALAVTSTAAGLEAERERSDPAQADRGEAWARLARDAKALADSPRAIDHERVEELAHRAAAIDGKLGDDAAKAEIAAAKTAADRDRSADPAATNAAQPATTPAKAATPPTAAMRLDALARDADAAAAKPEARAGVEQELAQLAGAQPLTGDEPAARAARLGELADRDRQLAAEERQARAAFAQAEGDVAQRLRRAQTAVDAAQAAPGASGEAAKRLAPAVPAAAAAADDLAARARGDEPAAGGAAPDPAAAERLAADARAQAEDLEHGLARPMTAAYAADAATTDPAALAPAAQAGQELASAAAQQRAAADALERALARRDRVRVELAQALAEQAGADAPGIASAPEAAQAQDAANAAARRAAAAAAAAAAAPMSATDADRAAAGRVTAQAQGDADAAQQAADQAAAEHAPPPAIEAHRRAQAAANRAVIAASARTAADAAATGDPGATAEAHAALARGAQARHALRADTAGFADQARAAAESARAQAVRERAAAKPGDSPEEAPGATAPRPDADEANADAAAHAPDAASAPSSPPRPSHDDADGEAARAAASQPSSAHGEADSDAQAQASAAASDALAAVRGAPQADEAWKRAAARLADAAARARLAQATSRRPSRSGAGGGGTSAAADATADRVLDVGQADGDATRTADWARLRDEARKRVAGDGVDGFTEEHQQAIRAYFKRLGEDK